MAHRADDVTRRGFLKTTTAGTCAAASLSSLLAALPRVSAEEAASTTQRVRFPQEIEPLVKLIEETPRERVLEEVGRRVQQGTSYGDVLAALQLAGVRNVQPRPSVGFKFHCVLVVNSCHLASLAGPSSDRWLPIFWGLDYFKRSQRDEARQSGWQMQPVDESRVPSADRARKMFDTAMQQWDVAQADAATAGLVRTAGATEVFNAFAGYAARDYRSIGHKAIFLANAWRTLQVIGWDFAEPVMRSLAFALLNHSGEGNPAENDFAADRPWRHNESLTRRIPATWLAPKADPSAPDALLPALRDGSPEEASKAAAELLASGGTARSIWDGVFVGAGELLMRQPGIIGLHSLTTANAVHYLWQNASDENLRKRLLLQGCSFVPMFRESAKGRGQLADRDVAALRQPTSGDKDITVDQVLADVSGNRMRAAENLRSYLAAGGDARAFVDEARRMIFLKGNDAHDYKFSSAVLEDYRYVSPEWRDTFLSTTVFNLIGSGARDNQLVDRTREALA